jgi:hypothetical protein
VQGNPEKEFQLKIEILKRDVFSEIVCEKENEYRFHEHDTMARISKYIVIGCIFASIPALFLLQNYILVWIASSFFMYMVYPPLLLIPTKAQGQVFPSLDTIKKHITSLHTLGIFENRKTLSTIFLNLFFINCRPLFVGYALIYGVAILFAVASGFYTSTLDPLITALVVYQSFAIIAFYAFIWKLKPYTAGLRETIDVLKKRIGKNERPVWLVFIAISTIISMIGIIVLTAVFLPGFTLSKVIASGDLADLGDTIAIVFVFVLQYFILRYIHGYCSRKMVMELSRNKVKNLEEGVLPALSAISVQTTEGIFPGLGDPESRYRDIVSYYLTSTMYRPVHHDLFGYFPVFLIQPDPDILKDKETLCMLGGTGSHC